MTAKTWQSFSQQETSQPLPTRLEAPAATIDTGLTVNFSTSEPPTGRPQPQQQQHLRSQIAKRAPCLLKSPLSLIQISEPRSRATSFFLGCDGDSEATNPSDRSEIPGHRSEIQITASEHTAGLLERGQLP